jgi:hypothetical protein
MKEKLGKLAAGTGCLLFVLAPAAGAVLYPRANWLFAIPIVLIAFIVAMAWFSKPPDALYFVERAERLLSDPLDMDVDEYESLTPQNPEVEGLIQRTFAVGAAPEDWVNLEESKKEEIRALIREMRGLSSQSK